MGKGQQQQQSTHSELEKRIIIEGQKMYDTLMNYYDTDNNYMTDKLMILINPTSGKINYTLLRNQIFLNEISKLFILIKKFNYLEEFEMSAKMKELAERTLIEYVKAVNIYKNIIEYPDDLPLDEIDSDFLCLYYILMKKIVFEMVVVDVIEQKTKEDVYLLMNNVINKLNCWYVEQWEAQCLI